MFISMETEVIIFLMLHSVINYQVTNIQKGKLADVRRRGNSFFINKKTKTRR